MMQFEGASVVVLVLFILGGLLLVLYIWMLVWIYRDATARGKEAMLWVLIALLMPIIGLVVYMLIRNEPERPAVYYPPAAYYPPPGYQNPPYPYTPYQQYPQYPPYPQYPQYQQAPQYQQYPQDPNAPYPQQGDQPYRQRPPP